LDAITVVSQNTSISQLMEKFSLLKMENKQIIDHFDRLLAAAQMEAFMKQNTSQSSRCHAWGHDHESNQAT